MVDKLNVRAGKRNAMRILSAADVRAALPMTDAIECMREAFGALARGEVTMPVRTALEAPGGRGVTLVMPARVDGHARADALAVKVVSVFPGNAARGLPNSQAAVLVFDPDTGRPAALLEGGSLTAIRTAAASGLATDLLARPDATGLAVIGAGVQARSHLEAMCAVRPIERVRIHSRSPARVDEWIAELSSAPWRPGDIARAASVSEALDGADVVCTTTTARTPVFADADLGPGAHVNAVGTFTPDAREVPGETVARAWITVDQREAAWEEAGELVLARDEGRIDETSVRGELGELVLDPALRPGDPEGVTLFKSVGVAVQDAIAARDATEAALRRDLGTIVDW